MTLKLKKIFVIVGMLILFVYSIPELKSQDITFSQPYNAPTYYNPAFVGLTLGLKTRFNYQKRWTGLAGNYYTYMFSADIADRNIPGAGGLGLLFLQDKQGMGYIKTTTIGVMPSVRIRSSYNTLFQLGATISAVNRKLDLANAVFSSQLDPIYGNIGPSSFSDYDN